MVGSCKISCHTCMICLANHTQVQVSRGAFVSDEVISLLIGSILGARRLLRHGATAPLRTMTQTTKNHGAEVHRGIKTQTTTVSGQQAHSEKVFCCGYVRSESIETWNAPPFF